MNLPLPKRIKRNRFYALASEIKWRLEQYASAEERDRLRVVSLAPKHPAKGNVLFSRINRAFLLKPGQPLPPTHKNLWEAYQMALIFLDLGFAVDVIDYRNNCFLPSKDYALFVDARYNMERIGPLLNRNCVKVLHTVTAHPLFQSSAELGRLLSLQQRRGITLRPRRQDAPNWGIEHADCATVLGNQFTLDTYGYSNKTLHRVDSASPFSYPYPHNKDFGSCRHRFLFLAGIGMVHKGLDRVLEAFAGMPDLSLTICGPVEKELDFVQAYHKELYETKNIHLAGWTDVSSQRFLDLANRCVALIHPSCSEGSATSVITCMHAGLVPVASVESGVDISPDFGLLLKESSIDEIRAAAQWIGTRSSVRLRDMSHAAWTEAREKHSPEHFFATYKTIISEILDHGTRSSTSQITEAVLK